MQPYERSLTVTASKWLVCNRCMSQHHPHPDSGLLMQGLKKGRSAALREPPADADTIPAGYLTPLKATRQTELQVIK